MLIYMFDMVSEAASMKTCATHKYHASTISSFFLLFFFVLDMFIQHTAFLLDKGSQDRRRGILPPAVSIYWYGLLILV